MSDDEQRTGRIFQRARKRSSRLIKQCQAAALSGCLMRYPTEEEALIKAKELGERFAEMIK